MRLLQPLVPADYRGHRLVLELDGLRQGGVAPTVGHVRLHLAHVQQEPDAPDVALGGRQVQRCPAIVVPNVHVDPLVEGAENRGNPEVVNVKVIIQLGRMPAGGLEPLTF